ncbi:hypothetical protein [Streptomyces sp. NPDC091219]|uniref:hypothetical protein n=1 Tax=Streptomyces sp. NPDC091219 TaxID=3155193 RepID=UPI003450AB98
MTAFATAPGRQPSLDSLPVRLRTHLPDPHRRHTGSTEADHRQPAGDIDTSTSTGIGIGIGIGIGTGWIGPARRRNPSISNRRMTDTVAG